MRGSVDLRKVLSRVEDQRQHNRFDIDIDLILTSDWGSGGVLGCCTNQCIVVSLINLLLSINRQIFEISTVYPAYRTDTL